MVTLPKKKTKSKYLTGSTPEARRGGTPIPTTPLVISNEEYVMLQTVKQYSWYINNAMYQTIKNYDKNITSSKESLKHDDGSVIYESLRGMLEHCEQAHKEFLKAYDALTAAGVK